MSDPSPSGETWVCRAAKGYTRCDILPCTVRGYPEHKRCGPVPSSDTPSDERDEVCGSMGPRIGDEPERPRCAQPLDHDGQHRGFPGSGFESVQWGGPIVRDGDFARTYRPAPPPTPVDGDSGEALRFTAEVQGERMIYVLVTDHGDSGETYSAGPFTDEDHAAPRPDVAAALAAQINRSSPPVGEERRPVDGGERSQSEQWFVVHHNQIRSLRFGTFPIERLARASIAACTCGPHTLRHTVTTTYTASTTEGFVAAATDRGDRA